MTILPILLSTTFLQLLDVTLVQVALPSITADLHAGQGTTQLVLTGYTLTYASLLLIAARLGDRYGYRRLFRIGLAVFTIGTVSSALAPTAGFLVLARLVEGVGSGLVAPQVFSLIQTALPVERRARALSSLGATMAVAALSGPLLGGVLLTVDPTGLGWRLLFLANVPVALLALAFSGKLPATALPATPATHPARPDQPALRTQLAQSGLPSPAVRPAQPGQPSPSTHPTQPGAPSAVACLAPPDNPRPPAPRIDLLGATLAASGLALLILPLSLGRDTGWPPWTWLTLATALTLLTLFARTQRRPNPLLHPTVLRDRPARTGLLLVLVFNAGVPSLTYLLLRYLQTGPGHTPLTAALLTATYPLAAALGSRLAPTLTRRHGGLPLAIAAAGIAVTTAALAAIVGTPAEPWTLSLLLIPAGLGFGVFTAAVFAVVLARTHPDAIGSASGLLPTAQQLGGTLGITLAGLVFAVGADPASGFGYALGYETVVFLIAAGIALGLSRGRG
ncbi:MFS transporter [Crossiella cryophila]|uniref:MFS family permease n=1 Tax=Crossiella cryophila TaxID=43355 RepID=A0A7W7CF83_9PSEU|nr:MFS transporter [Crossiella cryophila]MBB4680140.1 MFS family permease [Crossiella cryophila]